MGINFLSHELVDSILWLQLSKISNIRRDSCYELVASIGCKGIAGRRPADARVIEPRMLMKLGCLEENIRKQLDGFLRNFRDEIIHQRKVLARE